MRAGAGLKSRYFIVKLTADTPLYEEGYINYGFNKIQYFEHLRLRGTRLYLIAQSFAVDMPHPEWASQQEMSCSSQFRTAYVSRYVGRAVSSMETMYKKHQRKWAEKYAKTKKVQVCRRTEKMYSLV